MNIDLQRSKLHKLNSVLAGTKKRNGEDKYHGNFWIFFQHLVKGRNETKHETLNNINKLVWLVLFGFQINSIYLPGIGDCLVPMDLMPAM